MLRPIIIALAALLASATAGARTALDFFVEMPPEVFNMLSRTSRLDMIDYYNAGLSTGSNNAMGGKSRILKADSLAVDFLVSKSSLATLAVIPNGGDTVIAFIETVKLPTPDSSLRFFRADGWKPLAVEMPVMADFLSPEVRNAGLVAADFPPMTFSTVEFNPSTSEFTFRDRTAAHYALPEGARPEYSAIPYLKPEIKRVFRKGKLRKQ